MYSVVLIDKFDNFIKSLEEKSFNQAINVFNVWLKDDAFNGETLLFWDNENLIKEINVCKKSDYRLGESYLEMFPEDIVKNDFFFKKDLRKFYKKTYLNNN